jgi:hypothetical protein
MVCSRAATIIHLRSQQRSLSSKNPPLDPPALVRRDGGFEASLAGLETGSPRVLPHWPVLYREGICYRMLLSGPYFSYQANGLAPASQSWYEP